MCVAIGLYIGLYLTNVPGSAAAVETSAGPQLTSRRFPPPRVNDPHPTWVSYYAVDANDTNWRHVTTYVLPANTLVHVTIYQFDSQTGLRNPFIGQATGNRRRHVHAQRQDDAAIDPDTARTCSRSRRSASRCRSTASPSSAKNPCSNAPCPLSTDHATITFTFRTPGKGLYRWQCFVPCAAGFIQGFGGPMQTVGYMDGFIKVV